MKMKTDKLIVAGLMPNENWFMSNRMVYDPRGIAPTQLARPGGGATNALTKIIEVRDEEDNQIRSEPFKRQEGQDSEARV